MNNSILQGCMWHHRKGAKGNSFTHPICFIYTDVEQLEQVSRSSQLFAWNRWGIFSFKDEDFLDEVAVSLKDRAKFHLKRHGFSLRQGKISVLSIPRFLGFGFSPANFWFCQNSKQELEAIILELNSIQGEKHIHVLNAKQNRVGKNGYRFCFPKEIQYSPFSKISGDYHMNLEWSFDKMRFRMGLLENENEMMAMGMELDRVKLNDGTMFGAILKQSFGLLSIPVKILWNLAFLKWIRKMPMHKLEQHSNADTLGAHKLPALLRAFGIRKKTGKTGRHPIFQ